MYEELDELILDGSLAAEWDEGEQDFVFYPTEHPDIYTRMLTDFLEVVSSLEAEGLVKSSIDPETYEVYYELTDEGIDYIKGM